MNLQKLLANERIVYTLVAVLALAGAVAYLNMPRQEDPAFPYRAGLVTVAFPGADPLRVERLVIDPLEEELAGLEEIKHVISTARQGVAILRIELASWVYDTDSAWDRVRIALDDATRAFPDGVAKPDLDDRIVTASTAVLAITGSDDPLVLADAAERLKAQLLGLDKAAAIRIIGDPGKQITIALSDAGLLRTGLTPQQLLAQLQSANAIIPGGSLAVGGRSLVLRPHTDYASIAEIRALPIQLAGGGVVPLGAIVDVQLGAERPPRARVLFDGTRAVGLDIVAQRDRTHTVVFGEALRAKIDELAESFAPLEIHEMFYQPAYTEARLSNLANSLLQSVGIIIAVLFIGMGLRVGLLVATVLPLVTLAALAVYAMGGGVLHQIAIIGLVVALGMLVDNAIVVTEDIQHRLNAGASRNQAAAGAVRSLAGPLFAATGTTVAAFVPIALAAGNVADFIRAMPVLIMLSLTISYVFAVTFTPIVARRFLKPRKNAGGELPRFALALGGVSARHPWWLVGASAVLVVGAFAMAGQLDQQFFPNADRNQVVIDLNLPEGSHLSATQAVAARMEGALRGRPGVQAVHSFIGSSGPTFYYNLQRDPNTPQSARLVAITDGLQTNAEVIAWAQAFGRRELAGVEVVPTILRQGPPLAAPIAVRLFNPDPAKLAAATEAVFAAVLATPGARDVRHDLGTGAPSVVYTVYDSIARRLGITRVDVAQALLGRSYGVEVGQYRAGDDPVPIVLRSPKGQYYPLAQLETVYVYGAHGAPVPLAQVADAELVMQPGAIRHYDQHRVARVYSELGQGYVYSEVLGPIRGAIAALDLPAGTRVEYGGEAEASDDANAALLKAAPLGIGLLLFFILLQFNSFRRLGLVLVTVPFAIAGVIPGLLLLGIPFGFQPLQGLIALVGIVVNNAIVLIDVVDQGLAEGEDIGQAVRHAVARRTRPILLTTATTIAGLLPLALSDTTLWPPLAWTIITGLAASTLLTLLVLPALCRLLLAPRRGPKTAPAGVSASVFLAVALLGAGLLPASPGALAAAGDGVGADTPLVDFDTAGVVDFQPAGAVDVHTVVLVDFHTAVIVDFHTAVQAGSTRPQVNAQAARAAAAGYAASAATREALAPKLSLRARASRSDAVGTISIPTPGGPRDFTFGEREQSEAVIELRQPLFHPASQLYAAPAAQRLAESGVAATESAALEGAIAAAQSYLQALELRARLAANAKLRAALAERAATVRALEAAGRALSADVLDIELALQEAERTRVQLATEYRVATAELARRMGRAGRVQPAPLDYRPPPVTAAAPELLQTALAARRDLDALELRIRAAELQLGAARAQWLPKLDLVASQTWRSGSAFFPDDEARIGAQLTWTPFAGGAIAARRDQAAAELAALKAEREAFVHQIRVQIERQLAAIRQARALRDLAAAGVKAAAARRDVRAARFEAGRATAEDVVEAEAELARQRARVAVAGYRIVAAWIGLQGALARSGWVTALP